MEQAATFDRGSPDGRTRAPLPLRVGFWICIAIAVAVVVRRVVALISPTQGGPPQMAGLDAAFRSHAALTLAHILPALCFVAVAPFALLGRKQAWAQRALLPLGAVVGVTAYAMSGYAVGGWVERSAVLFFNTLFLYELLRAGLAMRAGDAVRQHRWMLRAVVVLLGIATTRPVMGVFFATSALTHWQPSQFFGFAFWIGFSINTLAVELWLRTGRGRRASGSYVGGGPGEPARAATG